MEEMFMYMVLTDDQRKTLERERILLLESDLFRAQMQLQESQSAAETAAVTRDINSLTARLSVRYNNLFESSDTNPVADDTALTTTD